MVNLIEVVLPPTLPRGVAGDPPGLLIVNGYEVGGRIIVVAVALGTLAPLRGVAFVGGFEVVRMVTLFMAAKLTCWAALVAFGTANNGRGPVA